MDRAPSTADVGTLGSMAAPRRWLALLGLYEIACGPNRGGPLPPDYASIDASIDASPSPIAAPGTPGPEDYAIGWIDAFDGQFCALARSGVLHCWGSVGVPGEPTRRGVPRALRMPGVPPLTGFVLVKDGLVGWDAEGNAISISDDIPPGFRVHEGVLVGAMATPELWSSKLQRVRVSAASQRCLLTPELRLLCNDPARGGTQYHDRFPGPFHALGTGSFACAVDEAGRPVAINASAFELPAERAFGRAMAPFEVRPLEGLPRSPTSLACSYGDLDDGKGLRALACATDVDQRLTCTDPALVTALEQAAEERPIDRVIADEHFCVRRRDGQARCVKTNDLPDAALLPSLVGYDASWGLALDQAAMCLLAFDASVRCWGQQGAPQLGHGAGPEPLPGLPFRLEPLELEFEP